MEIVEQLEVLAFRNPGDLVFCHKNFSLVQPPAALAGIARLANTDGVVGKIQSTLVHVGAHDILSNYFSFKIILENEGE